MLRCVVSGSARARATAFAKRRPEQWRFSRFLGPGLSRLRAAPQTPTHVDSRGAGMLPSRGAARRHASPFQRCAGPRIGRGSSTPSDEKRVRRPWLSRPSPPPIFALTSTRTARISTPSWWLIWSSSSRRPSRRLTVPSTTFATLPFWPRWPRSLRGLTFGYALHMMEAPSALAASRPIRNPAGRPKRWTMPA